MSNVFAEGIKFSSLPSLQSNLLLITGMEQKLPHSGHLIALVSLAYIDPLFEEEISAVLFVIQPVLCKTATCNYLAASPQEGACAKS